MASNYKNYTAEELASLVEKALKIGYIPKINADVHIKNNQYITGLKDAEMEVRSVEGTELHGYCDNTTDAKLPPRMAAYIDLKSYKELICLDYGEKESDIIDMWTEAEMDKEEQYARPDYIAFKRYAPIHELEELLK